jgi:hypothetical protein
MRICVRRTRATTKAGLDRAFASVALIAKLGHLGAFKFLANARVEVVVRNELDLALAADHKRHFRGGRRTAASA